MDSILNADLSGLSESASILDMVDRLQEVKVEIHGKLSAADVSSEEVQEAISSYKDAVKEVDKSIGLMDKLTLKQKEDLALQEPSVSGQTESASVPPEEKVTCTKHVETQPGLQPAIGPGSEVQPAGVVEKDGQSRPKAKTSGEILMRKLEGSFGEIHHRFKITEGKIDELSTDFSEMFKGLRSLAGEVAELRKENRELKQALEDQKTLSKSSLVEVNALRTALGDQKTVLAGAKKMSEELRQLLAGVEGMLGRQRDREALDYKRTLKAALEGKKNAPKDEEEDLDLESTRGNVSLLTSEFEAKQVVSREQLAFSAGEEDHAASAPAGLLSSAMHHKGNQELIKEEAAIRKERQVDHEQQLEALIESEIEELFEGEKLNKLLSYFDAYRSSGKRLNVFWDQVGKDLRITR